MLWTPSNEFQESIDNFGATYSEAGLGTAHTTGAANTKGTPTSLLAGASVTEDVYGIAIVSPGPNSAAATRNFLADLLIDPAGGTSWATLIANLMFCSPSLDLGGYWYYFPLYLKSGTSIGVQAQCQAATIAFRIGVKLFTKPSHPHLLRVGTKVQTYGADTANSRGTAITPGTAALGAYTASLGTSEYDQWFWQAGFGLTDTTFSAIGYLVDVAANVTNKVLCAENIPVGTDANEAMSKGAFGSRNQRNIAAGQDIYARAAGAAGPDTTPTVCVYGVGG